MRNRWLVVGSLLLGLCLVLGFGLRGRWNPRLIMPSEPYGSLVQRVTEGQTLYPRSRRWVFPVDGQEALRNPPSLQWPVPRWRRLQRLSARHFVELSTDPNFAHDTTQRSGDLDWAIWRPSRALDPGRWFWRYTTRLNGRSRTSSVFSFRIEEDTWRPGWPNTADMLSRLPSFHPRVLVRADQLHAVRERLAGSAFEAEVVAKAEESLRAPFPAITELRAAGVDDPSGDQRQKLKSDSVKKFGRAVYRGIGSLVKGHLLTGDTRYTDRAIAWALEVASLEVDGITYSKGNNFGSSALLKSMGVVYDSCRDRLSDAQAALLRVAIRHRTERFMRSEWFNRLEGQWGKGHPWQLLLHDALMAALAVHGEEPEAESWIAYIYELWLARFPALGGEGGSWAVGVSYLDHNSESMISIPTLFKELAGIDLFAHDFYRSVPHFCSAAPWDPGFADAPPDSNKLAWDFTSFIHSVQRERPTAWGAWYLDAYGASNSDWQSKDDRFAWFDHVYRANPLPHIAEPTPSEINDFVFYGNGLAMFHSKRSELAGDLMVAFQSSPMGSAGHAQREQNTFNLVYAGEPVFYRSGFRISMGDPHHLLYYTATNSKNGILVDGKGQAEHDDAFGHLARFGRTGRIGYAMGRAPHAYNPPMSDVAEEDIKRAGYRSKAGEAVLTRFDRHLLFLKPSTVIIYDVLAAGHPASWDFLLHARRPVELSAGKGLVDLEGEGFLARALISGSGPLSFEVDDRMRPPPRNWREHRDESGKVLEYPSHYHISASSREKRQTMRYLAVIEVTGKNTGGKPAIERLHDGRLRVGGWFVDAELDSIRPPMLQAVSEDGQHAASLGSDLRIGEERWSAPANAAMLLLERDASGVWQRQEVDGRLPVRIGHGFW